jgi:hypothetical protein
LHLLLLSYKLWMLLLEACSLLLLLHLDICYSSSRKDNLKRIYTGRKQQKNTAMIRIGTSVVDPNPK